MTATERHPFEVVQLPPVDRSRAGRRASTPKFGGLTGIVEFEHDGWLRVLLDPPGQINPQDGTPWGDYVEAAVANWTVT